MKGRFLSAINYRVSTPILNEELIKWLTEMSEKYSPCSAIVMNTEGQVVCQGILNDEFIKLTINQINKPVKKMNFDKNIDR